MIVDCNSWTELKFENIKPRFGHTSVVRKDFMYIFGGYDGEETLNEILIIDLLNKTVKQTESAKGYIKGRYRHSASCNDYAMYIFGGIDQNEERFNDLYEYIFESHSWSKVITIGNSPSKRTFH